MEKGECRSTGATNDRPKHGSIRIIAAGISIEHHMKPILRRLYSGRGLGAEGVSSHRQRCGPVLMYNLAVLVA